MHKLFRHKPVEQGIKPGFSEQKYLDLEYRRTKRVAIVASLKTTLLVAGLAYGGAYLATYLVNKAHAEDKIAMFLNKLKSTPNEFRDIRPATSQVIQH
jgi:hypothetical protein